MNICSMPEISGSVGREGDNLRRDVATVQSTLNALKPAQRRALSVDGRNGPRTMGAITEFQTQVCRFRKPDGRVDPGGRTWRAMMTPGAAAVWAGAVSAAPDLLARPAQDTVPASVPRGRSTELIHDAAAMAVFYPHLKREEGVIPYFYCCPSKLVTIGVGSMVDCKGSTQERDRRGRRECRELLNKWHVRFQKPDGSRASLEEVFEDWKRVRDAEKGAQGSKSIAQLRIPRSSCDELARKKIAHYARGMYGKYPFARRLHGWIQMALIDARWNPAKLNPWHGANVEKDPVGDKLIDDMWVLLNPDKPTFDPVGAQALFVEGWRDRGGSGYQERVAWRNARFLEGAQRMAG